MASMATHSLCQGLSLNWTPHLFTRNSFLAGDHVEIRLVLESDVAAIVRGTQPAELTAKKLIRRIELPLEWPRSRSSASDSRHDRSAGWSGFGPGTMGCRVEGDAPRGRQRNPTLLNPDVVRVLCPQLLRASRFSVKSHLRKSFFIK
jgi:hypothetical protein